MGNIREILKLVVVGHVDHGKSTIIGRMLYDTKSLPEGAIERVKKISKETGKPFEYAYLLDAFEEEQKQGITIDTTQLQFNTKKRDYIIIDAPGHKEFLKNMVSGAASAEAALLIIDGLEGIQEQSKRHGYILSLLGIQKIYVVVNKMDLIDYSQQKFEKIKKDMEKYLNNINVYPEKYIPVSGFLGENITKQSSEMIWYKEEPLLEALDLFENEIGVEDKPLRFPIQDVYKFDNRRIIAGRIETGSLQVGDEILIAPTNKVTRVNSIESWSANYTKEKVYGGMSVGITVEDEFFNKRGEIICHKNTPPLIGDTFNVNLFWLGKDPFVRDKKYKLKLATQEIECEIDSINKVIDATTLETIENITEVQMNDVAEVTINTKHKICLDAFKDNQRTGRFVIVDGFNVVGGGIVLGLEVENKKVSKLIKEEVELTTTCFEEYYFYIQEGVIKPKVKNLNDYDIGDIIPISGDTYSYPENFNIVDFHSALVAKIRNAELKDIIPISKFEFDYFPSVNIKGSYIKIYSQKDLDDIKNDFKRLDGQGTNKLAEFANKWLVIVKYRVIKYK